MKKLSELKIIKINDNFINSYLDSRNSVNVRNKMINKNKISKLDHYIWWFKNMKRANFALKKFNKILIFFWHKKIIINKKKFFIGGWWPNSKNVKIYHILYTLKKQLKITQKHKNIPWLAVIKKSNKFTIELNKNLGFQVINYKHNYFKYIKKEFKVSNKKYYYLIYNYNR
tara:strand:+ start:1408 stop:1920 length:513 start_codon:yes stop_codon:yes gene_type:complete